MTPTPETDAAETKPRRVTQGEIIMALLQRGSSQSSSVTIARNAKGDIQFEVVIRTDDDTEIDTPSAAMEVATTIADALAAKYPNGGAGAA